MGLGSRQRPDKVIWMMIIAANVDHSGVVPERGAKPDVHLSADLRRYDLDWLRICAFGVLIFYHVGMFYVTWDWTVKSRYSSTFLEPVMGLVSSLATLFFISGTAVRYMIDKSSWGTFVLERTTRLLLPLAFGIYVVCAPQTYLALLSWGEIEPGFLDFYRDYIGFGQYAFSLPDFHHLWYVATILAYTLLVAACLPLMRAATLALDRPFGWLAGGAWRMLLLPAIPFVLYVAVLEIYLSIFGLVWWSGIARTLTFFLLGFTAAKNQNFWNAVDRALPASIGMSLVLGVLYLAAWINQFEIGADTELLYVALLLRPLYSWSLLVMLLGLARKFANRRGRVLTYLTAAVFPYYILHQTIIVIVAYWFTLHEAPLFVEASVIVAATLLGCALGFEIIRRAGPIRLLFGMPWRRKAPVSAEKAAA